VSTFDTIVQWVGGLAGTGGGVTAGWLIRTVREILTTQKEALEKAKSAEQKAKTAETRAEEALAAAKAAQPGMHPTGAVAVALEGAKRDYDQARNEYTDAKSQLEGANRDYDEARHEYAGARSQYDAATAGLKLLFDQLRGDLEEKLYKRIEREVHRVERRSRPDPAEVELRGMEPTGRIKEKFDLLERRIRDVEDDDAGEKLRTELMRMLDDIRKSVDAEARAVQTLQGELRSEVGARVSLQETLNRYVERTAEWQQNIRGQLGKLEGRLFGRTE